MSFLNNLALTRSSGRANVPPLCADNIGIGRVTDDEPVMDFGAGSRVLCQPAGLHYAPKKRCSTNQCHACQLRRTFGH
jgi:hypothetical protein